MRIGAAILVLLATAPSSAETKNMRDIRATLSHLQTATGASAWDRMKACGIKIDGHSSSISPQYLDIIVELPRNPGGDMRLDGLSMRWARKGTSWTPDSGWAKRLTTDPGQLDWMPC